MSFLYVGFRKFPTNRFVRNLYPLQIGSLRKKKKKSTLELKVQIHKKIKYKFNV
jgi:hypothetical protein